MRSIIHCIAGFALGFLLYDLPAPQYLAAWACVIAMFLTADAGPMIFGKNKREHE